jgi:ABC-type Fe3+ transport system permease subunit
MTALSVSVVFGVPLAGLVWRAGLAGAPPEWSAPALARQFELGVRAGGGRIALGVLVAGVVGVLAAALALVLCWLCLDGRWLRRLVVGVAVVAWVMPGPVVGLGMKGTIEAVLRASGSPALEEALYRGRSWLPVVWVQVVRLLPFALAVLWPVVRLTPPRLIEAARADGAGALGELRHVVLPRALPAAVVAALVVTALALGELGASKLVSTPGARTFAEELFVQLHYRTGADVAVRALLLLVLVAGAVRVLAALGRRSLSPLSPANPGERGEIATGRRATSRRTVALQ